MINLSHIKKIFNLIESFKISKILFIFLIKTKHIPVITCSLIWWWKFYKSLIFYWIFFFSKDLTITSNHQTLILRNLLNLQYHQQHSMAAFFFTHCFKISIKLHSFFYICYDWINYFLTKATFQQQSPI